MARARSDRRHSRRAPAGERNPSAGRSLWSGSISFGLLQIPISLHTAERRSEEIHFRLLDRKDLTPIRNQRVNAESGKPVEWADVVKGYEYAPGTFVEIGDEDLKRANVAATQTVDIQDFVPVDAIAPEFFDTPYWAVPPKRAAKAYALLRDALKRKKAAAIATFVLRTRQHLCAVIPNGEALMIEVLRYGHELRRAEDLPLEDVEASAARASPRELEMAERLVEEMMARWEPGKYQDRFHDDVMKMIESKMKTGRVRAAHTGHEGQVASNVVDLVALLKKSVEQGRRTPAQEDDTRVSHDGRRTPAPEDDARAAPAPHAKHAKQPRRATRARRPPAAHPPRSRRGARSAA